MRGTFEHVGVVSLFTVVQGCSAWPQLLVVLVRLSYISWLLGLIAAPFLCVIRSCVQFQTVDLEKMRNLRDVGP